MKRCCRLLPLLVATLSLLVAPQTRSAVLSDDSALARWVDGTLAPELTRTLAQHPRFRGETLDFVALRAGAPQPGSSELYGALVQRLRQHLLRADGIRLLAPGLTGACAFTSNGPGGAAAGADRADLLLGIEISAAAGRDVRISLAVLDVAEAVWVSGISHAWTGRLSDRERAALAVRTPSAVPGSAASPFPEDDADRIAAVLAAQFECALLGGITGTTYLGAADRGQDARVAGALRNALAVTPLLVLSTTATDADWVLEVRSGEARSGHAREMQLLLTDARSGAVQQVAGVFVTPAGSAAARGPSAPSASLPEHRPERAWSPPLAEPQQLLGALGLRQVAPTGICSDPWGRVRACAEVTVELLAPAHLFIVTTRDGLAQPLSCAARPERSSAGERVFRLEVEDLHDARDARADRDERSAAVPDAGVYVLAAVDRGVAAELAQALQTAPGACGSPRDSLSAWIDALAAVLARHPGQIHWRALHLVRDEARVVRL